LLRLEAGGFLLRARLTSSPPTFWLESIFDRPAGVVIVVARLALACFALLAIWLDPTQPDRYPSFTYSVLALYVVYAVAVAVWQSLSRRPYPWAHVIDVYLIGTLIYLTQGPTSPFFVLATFALLSGTLQWGARGALATGAALVLIQLVVTAVDGVVEIDRFIMRGGYLIVGAALFAYYGAYRDRLSERLAKLAAWPPEDMESNDFPSVHRSLSHAATVMQSSRVMVVWETEDEPLLFVSTWAGGQKANASFSASGFEDAIASEIADLPFEIERCNTLTALTPAGVKTLQRRAVSEPLCKRLQITGRLASAPFKTATTKGRVFFIDPAWLGDELLPLLEIVGNRIGNQIQENDLRVHLQEAAVAKERERLADDLHDSTLQVMTAAALQLKELADQDSSANVQNALTEIRKQLLAQQREIRLFATQLRGDPSKEPVQLEPAIHRTLAKVEDVWKCSTRAEVTPASATVSSRIQREIDFILMEAAANACRHGHASNLEVTAEIEHGQLKLRIGNNGTALPGFIGILDGKELAECDVGPRSIKNRVAGSDGHMTLRSAADAVELQISLALT
jgi:signal transduction histidine kinase